ncbi:MAG: putative bifunctional diguanylate cyclase/phosphodiesterase [Actinomycetota bacterium]
MTRVPLDADADGVLRACRAAREAFAARRVSVWLYDLEASLVGPYVVSSATGDRWPEGVGRWADIPIARWPAAAAVLRDLVPIVSEPATEDARWPAGLASDLGIAAARLEPLATSRAVGVLMIEPPIPDSTPGAVEMLSLISLSAGQALARRDAVRLKAEAEVAREQVTAAERGESHIHRLYEEVLEAMSVEEAGETLVRIARDLIGTEHATLCLKDGAARISHVFNVGAAPGYVYQIKRLLINTPVSEWPLWNSSMEASVPAFVPAGGETLHFHLDVGSPMSSYAVVPLIGAEGPVGVLVGSNTRAAREWNAGERAMIGSFGRQAGVVVENTILRAADQRRLHELAYQSFHDPLTKLPNRSLFDDRVTHALTRADRRNEAVAVIIVDVDEFKGVNSDHGRSLGDELLVAISGRIQDCLRPEDTIGRFGGDEFAILVEDIKEDGIVSRIAKRVVDHLRAPFLIGGARFTFTASVGVALSWPGCIDPGALVRNADLAMYRAKSKGKGRIELFDEDRDLPGKEGIQAESALRRALEGGELLLHYQPKVDLSSGSVIGFEALIRWDDPDRGVVPPGEFLPLAERTGAIVPIGRWVLETVCFRLRRWLESSTEPPPVVWFNLCAPEFQQPDLVVAVEECLARHGVPPDRLGLEITEGTLMDDADTTIQTLRALRGLGVNLALDDFGAGYSSLSYLKRFQVDALKIDRSFVGNLIDNDQDVAIVSAVTALAGTLGQRVVAEGVETIDQLRKLRALGCSAGQGYYFSRPVPAAEAEALFTNPPPWEI